MDIVEAITPTIDVAVHQIDGIIGIELEVAVHSVTSADSAHLFVPAGKEVVDVEDARTKFGDGYLSRSLIATFCCFIENGVAAVCGVIHIDIELAGTAALYFRVIDEYGTCGRRLESIDIDG